MVILPEDASPQLYVESETAPLLDNLERLLKASQESLQEDTDTSTATDQDQQTADDTPELDPDGDGVAVFVDQFLVADTEGSVPKKDLYQVYVAWAERLTSTTPTMFGLDEN
ncbi:hypothetical protein [Natronorubrum aibiense]|uniref:Uncharacterized protein n=1 Tax=Natronorubrum aibiense TaxID=348826 RepID=A0A5P9PA18_9EURY|nr:hypothetical protein [Natronorubrum aibiense]QFU84952.1 hypothetical protein GCU68_20750 [Natronorubrum aibiense]